MAFQISSSLKAKVLATSLAATVAPVAVPTAANAGPREVTISHQYIAPGSLPSGVQRTFRTAAGEVISCTGGDDRRGIPRSCVTVSAAPVAPQPVVPDTNPAARGRTEGLGNIVRSRNDLPRIPGARTQLDFQETGHGGPTQRTFAVGSYRAFPYLLANQQAQYFNTETGNCVIVAGGSNVAADGSEIRGGNPRRVVSRRPSTPAQCPTQLLTHGR